MMLQCDAKDFNTSLSAVNNECSIANYGSDTRKSTNSVIEGKCKLLLSTW